MPVVDEGMVLVQFPVIPIGIAQASRVKAGVRNSGPKIMVQQESLLLDNV